MAVLTTPELQETAIREVLGKIPLPEGARLQGLEFKNDSSGEPALFVIYTVTEPPYSDEMRAQELQTLRASIRQRLREFGLPLFPYTTFLAA